MYELEKQPKEVLIAYILFTEEKIETQNYSVCLASTFNEWAELEDYGSTEISKRFVKS